MKGPAALSANIFFPMVFVSFLIASRTLDTERNKKKKERKKEKGNRASVKQYLLPARSEWNFGVINVVISFTLQNSIKKF